MFQLLPVLQEAFGGGGMAMLLPIGLIFVVFYFLIIRPQNKKQKETQAMLAAVKKGDRVTTAGGIRGDVQVVKDDTVIILVDKKKDVKLEFNKSAISSVNAKGKPAKAAKPAEEIEGDEEDEETTDQG